MMDFLSLIWTVLRDCGIASWGVVIAAVLFVCVYLLVKEYGHLHRASVSQKPVSVDDL
ncbi:hypothetical protein [Caproicibacter fermentans]|uniref:Uncharacterized protein n=1 Tax=Caproicibacter fermentans TaxID=2576756 RepID=A0A7G8T8Q1_9FIRM|nr:hypothetical protein [Caproicibacter fermentans]QNK39992.1 hypothetical protein HCR03_14960 [Caproicibacter fermentans]